MPPARLLPRSLPRSLPCSPARRPLAALRRVSVCGLLGLAIATSIAQPAAAAGAGDEADHGPVLREGRAAPVRRAAVAAAAASGPITIELRVPTGAPAPAQRASAPSRRPVASTRSREAAGGGEMEALRQRISERLRQLREREEAAPPPAPRRAAPAAHSPAAPRHGTGLTAPAPSAATASKTLSTTAAATATAAADALDPGEVRVDAPVRAPVASLAHSVPAPVGPGMGPGTSADAARAAANVPPQAAHAVDPRGLPWAYAGPAGPPAWGRLKPEYALCARGQRQSPIALRDGLAVDQDPLGFDYPALPITVHDTGHGLEVTMRGQAALLLRGDRYPLVRISLHRPGQGSIDGRRYPMSVQLLHRDGQGRQVMLALMVEAGAAQPAVQQVLNNLPLEPGSRQAAVEPLALMSLLPAGGGENAGGGSKPGAQGYWTYMGSLTEPPCTEGVLWVVLKQPITMSPEQLALFARLHPENARPEQPAAGRRVKVSR